MQLPDIDILYEDNHLIIVNKPYGILTISDVTGDKSLLDIVKEYVKIKYNKPGAVFLGCVHRLDRPVSGVIVFARTSKALERMNELFRNRETKKFYLAIVKNAPPEEKGTLVHYLVKNHEKNVTKAFKTEIPKSKRAELEYQLMGQSDHYYLLKIRLKTGRHHQIRSQLSAIGCPIKGDLKYGFGRTNPEANISLHSYLLEFVHPVKNIPVAVECYPKKGDVLWSHFKDCV